MRKSIVTMLAITGFMSAAAFGADREIKVDDRLDASADTLIDMMRASDQGIPQDLLNKARCVIVVPGMKKAGFIFAAKYGRGFAVCRRHGGSGWGAPAGMRVEGGSVGFQIGASETDVVLLVMNDGGIRHLESDKFTLGGEATAAAGPAGIALDGATIRTDGETNRELYGRDTTNREILHGNLKTPAAAGKFERALNRDSAQRSR